MMQHKGYVGLAEVDDEAGIIFGRVVGLRDVITFQGRTVEEARRSFEESVDFYLETCAADGVAPERPYSGKILIRTRPEIHRALATQASLQGKSLNDMINHVLIKATRDVGGTGPPEESSRAGRGVKAAGRRGRARSPDRAR